MKTWYIIERNGFAGAIADVTDCDVGLDHGKGHLITRINVMEQYRGQGLGTEVLKQVLADADLERTPLYLEPAPSGPLTAEDLETWYRRHGFEYAEGAWYMVRYPQ